MRIGEAARLLSISPRTLWEYTASGRVRSYKVAGLRVYARSDILAYLDYLQQLQAAGDRRVKRR